MRSSQSAPSQCTSAMIESTYSCSSFSGLVSSKRRLVLPPNSAARPKLMQMDLAWPMWRYPLGSGGKRVCTRPLYLFVFRSSRMMSRMKFERVVASAVPGAAAAVTSRSGVVIAILGSSAKGKNTGSASFAGAYILRGGRADGRLGPANLREQHGHMRDGGVVGAHAFWSFCLDADTRRIDTQQPGDILLNRLRVRTDLGRSKNQRAVHVSYDVARLVDLLHRFAHEQG